MDKARNYLALARKAGRVELGEEPVGSAARGQKARLIIVAEDASDHSWRRALSYVAGTRQNCLRVPFTREELGQAVGRTSLAMAAFTDPGLALGFVRALPPEDRYRQVLEDLERRDQRVRQRQTEEKAHQRNLRRGRHKPGTKQD